MKRWILTTIMTIPISFHCVAQRVDEEMPKLVSTVYSIPNLTGWQKNDLGQWKSFTTLTVHKVKVNKISLLKIRYQSVNYYCLASFETSQYLKRSVWLTEHTINICLFKPQIVDTLNNLSSGNRAAAFKITFVGAAAGSSDNDILVQVKKAFVQGQASDEGSGLMENMAIAYNNQSGKARFLLIGYTKTEGVDNFFSHLLFWTLPDCNSGLKMENLECGYYEVGANDFKKLFGDILPLN